VSDASTQMESPAAAFTNGAPRPSEAQITPLPRISIQAFCETEDVASMIEEAIADRRFAKTTSKVQMGGIPAAVEAFRDAPTPNMILLETFAGQEILIQQLDALAAFCDSDTRVVVIGHENDIALYRNLMARGVSDYIVWPTSLLNFINQLSHLYTSSSAQALGRTICVVGAKGGVGTSTIAHNLAWSISQTLKLHSVIIDLDLAFGTAALNFNQDPPQGVADAVFSPDRIDEIFVDRLLSKCSDTLSILAAPVSLDRSYDLSESAFDATIGILRATTPAIIIDMPHQWTAWSRRVMMTADELVIVAAPDLANLRNAKIMIDALKSLRRNDHSPRMILNMIGMPRRPEISPAEFIKAAETNDATLSSYDAKLFGAAANNGQMLEEIDPNAKIVNLLNSLGHELMGRQISTEPKNILDRFLKKFGLRPVVQR
jgi:pilus assembly protein CpaE